MIVLTIECENLILYVKNLFHFKMKNLKPCKGFKPNACRVLSFPQNWKKVAPRWYNCELMRIYELVQGGLIYKLPALDASKWTQATLLKICNIIPYILGKISVFHLGNVIIMVT